MTYAEFLSVVEKYHDCHRGLRYGQVVMNCLWSMDLELYEQVCLNHLDVFQSTDVTDVAQTLSFVSARLQSPHRSAI